MLTVHDWISGRAARVEMLEKLFRPLVDDSRCWIATCGELAAHHLTLPEKLQINLGEVIPINSRNPINE